MPEGTGPLIQLRAWLAQRELAENDRVPPERELCNILGVSRGELRKALNALEEEGVLWRQVGKGTFIGVRPADEPDSLTAIAARSSPRDVMEARLKLEPLLAFEASLNATPLHIEDLKLSLAAARDARSWRHYETCDNRFHRTIADAGGNTVLTALFDQLNAIRRTVVWARGREDTGAPPRDHHSFVQHELIFRTIADRDPRAAQIAMFEHLRTVEQRLLRVPEAVE